MRRVFSTPTFYTSFHYTARLLVTVIKAYWRLLSCRKQVPSPLPFPRSRANEFDFPLKVKKILQKRKRKEKKYSYPIVSLTRTLEDILNPNGETERRSSRIESYEFDCLFFIWAGKWCTRVDEIRFCSRAMSQSMSDILFDELNAACHRYGVNASQEEGREGG